MFHYIDIGHRPDGTCLIWWTDQRLKLYTARVPVVHDYTYHDTLWGHSHIAMCDRGEATFTGRIDEKYKRVTIGTKYQHHSVFLNERMHGKAVSRIIRSLIRLYPEFSLYQVGDKKLDLVYSPSI